MVTPKDLVDALIWRDGMRGTVAELFDVDFNDPAWKIWDEGMKPGGRMAQIGRVNIIEYTY